MRRFIEFFVRPKLSLFGVVGGIAIGTALADHEYMEAAGITLIWGCAHHALLAYADRAVRT